MSPSFSCRKLQGALYPPPFQPPLLQGPPPYDCSQYVGSLKTKSEGPGDWQDALGGVKEKPESFRTCM